LKDGVNNKCTKCSGNKPPSRKDNYCIECRREYNRAWERKNREKRRKCRQLPENRYVSKKKQRLKRYGLTLDEWNDMRVNQSFKCKICGTHETDCQQETLCVDHCHTTGKVRGLLCHTCNRAIGLLKDDVSLLLDAVKYLKEA
jgi:hypothetical protein